MRPSSSPSEPEPASSPSEPEPGAGAADGEIGLFDEVTARGRVRDMTGDRAWLQALLDAEAALVEARAEVGLTTAGRARRVRAACRAERFDLSALGRDAAAGGNPVIPLVRALAALVAADAAPGAEGGLDHRSDDEAREAADEVHRGATSQDILDTAAMLVVRRSLDPLLDDLEAAAGAAAELARAHAATPMAGRTLLQQATPTTFGLKAAGWLVALDDAAERLDRVRRQRLAVQLGGATGTLSGFEGRGGQVVVRFSQRLGLHPPVVAWHTDRSRVGDVAAGLAIAAGVAGKVALDIVLLAQSEVAEVSEGVPGRGGSSAMPHKRNPVAATLARAAAARAPGLASTLMAVMGHEHERAAGPWHAEWRPLTELLRTTGSAAAWLADCLTHLRVHPERMRHNLALGGDLMASERVAAALAPMLGTLAAHDLVGELGRRAAADATSLGELLAADRRVRAHLGADQVAALLDPARSVGEASALVDRALADHARRR